MTVRVTLTNDVSVQNFGQQPGAAGLPGMPAAKPLEPEQQQEQMMMGRCVCVCVCVCVCECML